MAKAEDKKEQKSVMQLEDADAAYISDIPISVGSDGGVTVDVIVTAARVAGVRNTRENTGVVYPDTASPPNADQRRALLASLVDGEDRVNAKHFVLTRHAGEYLRSLNAKDPTFTDTLVKKTNLFCVDLESKREFGSVSPEYTIDVVRSDDRPTCAEVSRFQQDTLPGFRKLTGDENIRKTRERYDIEAFNSRVASPEISIFTIRRGGRLLGTFTLNMHQISDVSESARFGYLSDLFVAEGLENDPTFINQFIGGVFTEIGRRHPTVKVLSVMAAAGDPSIPIVKCFNHAKDAALIKPFTRTEQERLGVVAHFTLKPENAPNTHLPPQLPRGVLSHLSVLAANRSRPATSTTAPTSTTVVPSSSLS